MIKKFLISIIFILSFANNAFAKTSVSISNTEGYDPYNGWIVVDMTFNNGTISEDAAYSINFFKNFGLVPIAYCSSGGSHLGTYYIFYVNPYHDCLIIGKCGTASHSNIFSSKLSSFKYSGDIVYYTDINPYQNLYRKAINIAKSEFNNYQTMMKNI